MCQKKKIKKKKKEIELLMFQCIQDARTYVRMYNISFLFIRRLEDVKTVFLLLLFPYGTGTITQYKERCTNFISCGGEMALKS